MGNIFRSCCNNCCKEFISCDKEEISSNKEQIYSSNKNTNLLNNNNFNNNFNNLINGNFGLSENSVNKIINNLINNDDDECKKLRELQTKIDNIKFKLGEEQEVTLGTMTMEDLKKVAKEENKNEENENKKDKDGPQKTALKDAIWKALEMQAVFDEKNKDLGGNNGTYCSCNIVKIEDGKYAFLIKDPSGKDVKIIFDKNSLFEDSTFPYDAFLFYKDEIQEKYEMEGKEYLTKEETKMLIMDTTSEKDNKIQIKVGGNTGERYFRDKNKLQLSVQAYGSLLQKLASIHYDRFIMNNFNAKNIKEDCDQYKLGNGVRKANLGITPITELNTEDLQKMDYVTSKAYEDQIWRNLRKEAKENKQPNKDEFVIQEDDDKDGKKYKFVIKDSEEKTIELIFDKGAFFAYKFPSGCGNPSRNVFNQFVYSKDWSDEEGHYQMGSNADCKFFATFTEQKGTYSIDFSSKAEKDNQSKIKAYDYEEYNKLDEKIKAKNSGIKDGSYKFCEFTTNKDQKKFETKILTEDYSSKRYERLKITIPPEFKEKIRNKLAELGFGHLSAMWNAEEYKKKDKDAQYPTKCVKEEELKSRLDEISKKNNEEIDENSLNIVNNSKQNQI